MDLPYPLSISFTEWGTQSCILNKNNHLKVVQLLLESGAQVNEVQHSDVLQA